ncbi:MAG: MarR family winged helix-turn-helix transcriptional regulator [Breznakia sp.]
MEWQKLDSYTKLYTEAETISMIHMRPFYEEHNINHLKCSILGQIKDNSMMTLNLLSYNLGKAATNLSVVVSKMEEEGYITRKRSKSDGRVVYFELNKKGENMVAGVRKYAADTYGELFEEGKELENLINAFEKYVELLKTVEV